MEPDWQREHQWAATYDSGNTPHGCAQGQRFRPKDGHRLARKHAIYQGGFDNPCHVLDRGGPDRSVVQAHEGENRESVERVAQVIEHVVAFAVNDPAFEYREIKP